MSGFKVGYAEVNINPPLGNLVCGYYIPRVGEGFLDDLQASALVLSCNGVMTALISVDSTELYVDACQRYNQAIEVATGIPKENIFIAATHTHTAPLAGMTDIYEVNEEEIRQYAEFLQGRLIDAVRMAVVDLKEARMGYIVGYAPERVAYIRRYRMKDGTTMTCPPINDPNIDHPIGELDQRVNVLRFDREGGVTVVLVNYGLHADTINGNLFSADWPGWMRKTLEKALDGVKCMFFAGAEGDVGSTNVHPSGGDMNDTEISFDNEMKSPGEPFTDIGVGIKEAEGWSMILPCALVNGAQGYFPMKSAFDEGGYEARTSPYKSGVAEAIIDGAKCLLKNLKN